MPNLARPDLPSHGVRSAAAESRKTGFPLGLLAGLALLACVFTVVQIQQSLDGGRLALPPTYDDVGYMLDAQQRLRMLYDDGPLTALIRSTGRPTHSPWSTGLAMAAFAVLGWRDWAPAAANVVVVFGGLLWLRRGRLARCPGRALLAAAVLLTWPLFGHAVVNARPDFASGLLTAATALGIAGAPWLEAGRRRHYLAGAGLGVALLIKPTVAPVTALLVTVAIVAATVTDVTLRKSRAARGAAWVAASRCVGLATVIALPYFLTAYRRIAAYIWDTMVGEQRAIWALDLTVSEHVLYYLTGPGGEAMLGPWRLLWWGLAAAAIALVAARRDRDALVRLPARAVVTVVAYLAVTIPPQKSIFLGVVLPSLFLLMSADMLAYLLARGRRDSRVLGAAAASAVGVLLLTGAGVYRWPIDQVTGGAPPDRRRDYRASSSARRRRDGDPAR